MIQHRSRDVARSGRTRSIILALAVALVASGCNLFTWGDNGWGQLGDGTRWSRGAPAPAARNPGWKRVEAGSHSACGIDVADALWCWGSGNAGQLGVGEFRWAQTTPARVGTSNDWRAVSVGGFSGALPELDEPIGAAACGIRTTGTLWCWGAELTQFGGTGGAGSPVPVQVGSATGWTSVDVGAFHACAIRTGEMWCWGRNDYGQLGNGTTTLSSEPVRVGDRSDWTAVTAGFSVHTCGIAGGDLWCWGGNQTGQLGDGTTADRHSPVPVSGTGALTWTAVGSGGFGEYLWYDPWHEGAVFEATSCALETGGQIWCWGDNLRGQLGDGTTVSRPLAEPITSPAEGVHFTQLTVGGLFACGLATDRYGYCWGWVPEGSLYPSGSTEPPVTVPKRLLHRGWFQVSAGAWFAVGVLPPEGSG